MLLLADATRNNIIISTPDVSSEVLSFSRDITVPGQPDSVQ